MNVRFLVSALVLGFGLSMSAPAGAQATASPDALAHRYFDALYSANGATLSAQVAPSFHVITPRGKHLNYDAFIRGAMLANTLELPPQGTDVKVKSSNVSGTTTTATVDVMHYFNGATSEDPMMGPRVERDYSTHVLTWTKSPSGEWLLNEDHITYYTRG